MRTRATSKRETSRRRGMKPAVRSVFARAFVRRSPTAPIPACRRRKASTIRARQGFLRRRLHRRHQGPQVAPDRRGRARDRLQSRAPRRGRRRSARRRRRRHPGADPAQASSPRRPRQHRLHAARARRIRGRRAVHAARSGLAAGDPRHLCADDQARGHDAARLARRADRQLDARRKREADRAGAPAGVHRPRQEDQERGRVRAPALHPAQVDLERDLFAPRAPAVGLLPGVDLLPHGRLQGHVPGRPAQHLLSRPARHGFRERARAGASALLDQHLPDLVARASLPDDRPQRRDQHAARQQQLDGGAAGVGVVEAVRRRHQPSCGRSPTKASPTPPASTTRSNSWCRAATRSRTR